jgi:hypothetical protein
MRTGFLFLFIVVLSLGSFAQGIGNYAPEKEQIHFPPHTLGLDIMFGEGGFGLGAFYRKNLTDELTAFVDLSVSEAKDENEFEYVDYWGNVYVYGKKNRILLLPVNFGAQYRLFSQSLGENLRPYIGGGIGPAVVITTPYEKEFFSAFGKAQAKYTLGGYIGAGANFGIDMKSSVGVNIRYYIIHLFGDGVESLAGRPRNDVGGFYITLNLGTMY